MNVILAILIAAASGLGVGLGFWVILDWIVMRREWLTHKIESLK